MTNVGLRRCQVIVLCPLYRNILLLHRCRLLWLYINIFRGPSRDKVFFIISVALLWFGQGQPVGSEGGWAVDQSTVLLEPLRDAFLPLQSPDGSGVESGEEGEVGVEVVVLAEPLHDLDELDDQSFALPGVLLLKNFRSKIFWNIKIFVTSLLPLRDRP